MPLLDALRSSLSPFLVAVLFGLPGCTVLPIYKHPNRQIQEEPEDPVGTYNMSLNVPWYLDFATASERQAAGCRRFLTTGTPPPWSEAPCEGIAHDRNFVALAISGGGSRSAAMSAAIMWELGRIGILKHVDVISASSGGAQAAALYALTHDAADAAEKEPGQTRYLFDPGDPSGFVDVFSRNLTLDWLVSLFMPWHFGPYAVTYFDRTDVMADTLADNYYPRGSWYDINWGMRFRDLNPKRPNLVINAVDMSLRLDEHGIPKGVAGRCFTFSYETFSHQLESDPHDFPVSQGAMASAAYPGIFHYLSLRDFSRTTPEGEKTYIHLADGGVRDHLALVPINAMLRRFAEGQSLAGLSPQEITQACEFSRGARSHADQSPMPPTADADSPPELPEKILLIVIDAGRPPVGFDETDADPRAEFFDYLLPVTKLVDVVDATLDDQRALRAMELIRLRKHLTGKMAIEARIRDCASELGESSEALATCLRESRLQNLYTSPDLYGPECCPIVGMGIHNFTKFANPRFGPLNIHDLDSDKVWGADLVTLECLADNDYGRGSPDSLYSKVRSMDVSLALNSEELKHLKNAANALVDEMLADFCDGNTGYLAGVEAIACSPPEVPREVGCKN